MSENNFSEAEPERTDRRSNETYERYRRNLPWWILATFAGAALVIGAGFLITYIAANIPN